MFKHGQMTLRLLGEPGAGKGCERRTDVPIHFLVPTTFPSNSTAPAGSKPVALGRERGSTTPLLSERRTRSRLALLTFLPGLLD